MFHTQNRRTFWICTLLLSAFTLEKVSEIARAHDLPRRLPASVAEPTPYMVSRTAQPSIQPLPDAISVTNESEIIPIPDQGFTGESITGPTIIEQPGVEQTITEYPGNERFPDTFPGSDPTTQSMPMTMEPGMLYVDGDTDQCIQCPPQQCCWTSQILPEGLIWHSYLAGPKEPRFAAIFWNDKDLGWNLDYTVGGRFGLFRYGSRDNIWPQGFQIDIEGAAFPRVNLHENMDLDAADYRVGIPFTYGIGKWQTKLEVYHLSAHVGDEFLIRNPGFQRINYVRDAIVLGGSYYPVDLLRLYGEVEYAFNIDGGAKPWAFQFGAELSPLRYNGCGGDPFVAINAYLREEVNYGGNLNVQAGWQWRGDGNRRLLRTGLHYQVGKSNQFEFFTQNEQQIGIGVWYDF